MNKNAYYYLRSLPFVAGVVLFLYFLWLQPELVRSINSYITTNPEGNFEHYGWSLYFIIFPFCIMGLSRPKRHWMVILAYLLAPIALAFSYWLWELLGWVVMGVYLTIIVTLATVLDNDDSNSYKIYEYVMCIACGIYAVLRVIGGISSFDILGLADVGFVTLIGGYFMVTSIIDCFKYQEGYETIVLPADVSFLYILVIPIMMLIIAGVEGAGITSAGGLQYSQMIKNAESAEDRASYREAANYYAEAAKIRHQKKNTELVNIMTHKADSIESQMVHQIPKALDELRKEKRTSKTYEQHVGEINKMIILLEKNASLATSKTTIEGYKKRLMTATQTTGRTISSQTSSNTPKTAQIQAQMQPKTQTQTQTQSQTSAVNLFNEAKAKADAGDAASCYKVAVAYKNGDGVGKNLSSAFSYMKKAADSGYTPAYIEVAKMYHGGRGVTKDRNVAEQWYKKAANAGNAEAKRILLNM